MERVARLANDRTRTLGVAFAGCTLPGADTPLFTVPDGQMGVGLGIHGEPGVADADLPRAADLARRLVDGVLAAYRRHLAEVTTEELEPQVHRTRWGELMSVENLLEHAVVHPMRHRLQLERLLEGPR